MLVKFKNMNVFNKAKNIWYHESFKKRRLQRNPKTTSLVFYFRNQMIIYNYMKVKYLY